jgi:hypothetical protein
MKDDEEKTESFEDIVKEGLIGLWSDMKKGLITLGVIIVVGLLIYYGYQLYNSSFLMITP